MSNTIIRATAEKLRLAIERAKEANADIRWLSRFPKRSCNFTANLLLLELAAAGIPQLRRMYGAFSEDESDNLGNHVWVLAGVVVVDISADQYGQPKVIVEEQSEWHDAFNDIKPFIERCDLPEGVPESELNRLRDLYEKETAILSQYY